MGSISSTSRAFTPPETPFYNSEISETINIDSSSPDELSHWINHLENQVCREICRVAASMRSSLQNSCQLNQNDSLLMDRVQPLITRFSELIQDIHDGLQNNSLGELSVYRNRLNALRQELPTLKRR